MTPNPLTEAIRNTARAPAPAALMGYQQRWVADSSPLKVCEKSRRVGITWAEASDDVLIAASERAAGGSNVYYIGYNMDMAVEFIEACAFWARIFNRAASEIEEGEELFRDDNDAEQRIKTYVIRFPSGFRIVALSSRPANLRGKQGVVVIDEAAFHGQLDELLKAAIALLIWGGKVRVISTHDGDENPFNELVQEIRGGKRAGTVHRITLMDAVGDGLFERVCMRLGKEWAETVQVEWVGGVYKFYGEAANEELDVIPSQGSGAWLTTALIEKRMHDAPVLRYVAPKGFEQEPELVRHAVVQHWIDAEVAPLLARLDTNLQSHFGMDFGRSGDLTVITPGQTTQQLKRVVPFAIELRNMPFAQQKQVLWFVIERLPRFAKGKMDARGNGQQLAEETAQKFGFERIECVMLTEAWYRDHMPPLKTAFEDDTIVIPRDADWRSDIRLVRMIKGVPRIPDLRLVSKAGDGKRHGDAAVSLAMYHSATLSDSDLIDFHKVEHSKDTERAIKIGGGWRNNKGIW